MENCNIALNFVKNNLGIRLIGIGSEDIVDGQIKLLLGLLWSAFRKLSLGSLLTGAKKNERPEDSLLNWIREQTADYEGVKIENFTKSFNDGLAWAALIDRLDPGLIAYDSLDKSNPEETLNTVFSAAEKLGIPKLFDAKDLTEGEPDARSVMLYSSLFYHHWNSKSSEERAALLQKRTGRLKKKDEMQAQLESAQEELAKVKAEYESMVKTRDELDEKVLSRKAYYEKLEKEVAELEGEKQSLLDKLKEARDQRLARVEAEYETISEKRKVTLENLKTETKDTETLSAANVILSAENEAIKAKLRAAGINVDALLDSPDSEPSEVAFGMQDLTLLRGFLKEHVDTLHTVWKGMLADEPTIKDKNKVVTQRNSFKKSMEKAQSTSLKQSDFNENVTFMSKELSVQSRSSMLNLIHVKDAVNELCQAIDKKGYLSAQVEGKRWKKRFFVLRGSFLSYYAKQDDINQISEGELPLQNTEATAESFKEKPKWGIRLAVSGNEDRSELLVGAKNRQERDDWLSAIVGKVVYYQYLTHCESEKIRPDTRLVSLLSSQRLSVISLDGRAMTAAVLKIFFNFIEIHPEIETISFVNAKLGDAEVAVLAGYLKSSPKLRTLTLRKNNITSAGLTSLTEALSESRSLRSIDLSFNQIADVSALAGVLKANRSVRLVNLCNNQISGDISALCASLAGLKELSAINLGNNLIGDDSAESIAGVLNSKAPIETVDLKGNKITDTGAVALFAGLSRSKTVKTVDLSNNSVGNGGFVALQDLLAKNKTLQSVDLSGTKSLVGGKELEGISSLDKVEVPALAFKKH
eukprot:TRINITY_DN5535_c0_g1_i2.p1 TRINITY_DN5535_c0_g1~~TRINITY_DN5535_c0_g1_i2.p1  ORF type:complete len:811 (-),score=188.33 TRINITY_DN5535_c0_g1_i2:38-2470(-)